MRKRALIQSTTATMAIIAQIFTGAWFSLADITTGEIYKALVCMQEKIKINLSSLIEDASWQAFEADS